MEKRYTSNKGIDLKYKQLNLDISDDIFEKFKMII
jgi:hypothetical protein